MFLFDTTQGLEGAPGDLGNKGDPGIPVQLKGGVGWGEDIHV